MPIRVLFTLVMAGSIIMAGCKKEVTSNEAPPAATETTTTSEPHQEHASESSSAPTRVFFVQPANGATVKSPVQFVFGSEAFTIAAVPAGEVKDVRAGMGHYHLGVDTDCLPDGQLIPKASPWIHFGDGKNTIDVQLAPGPHKLAVQAGDDLHQTVPGLCETISITVID